MGGYVVEQIEIIRLFQAFDETDAFGIGDGVRERLREASVARKFEHAELLKLIGAEILIVIGEAGFRGFEHALEIVFVAWLVIDLQLYAVRFVSLYFVTGREEREEIIYARVAHGVFEIAAAAFGPFALEIAGGDGDLIGRCADDGVESDPFGIRGEEIDVGIVGIARRSKFFERPEMLFAAADGIVQLDATVIADEWEIAAIEENAVVGELGDFVAGADTARGMRDAEIQAHGFVGFERLIQRVDGIEMFFISQRLVKGAIEAQFVYGFAAI